MSSAILYVAIVAIWAGVLIPRWLRRDTSAATATSEQESEAGEPAEEIGDEEETAWAEVGEVPLLEATITSLVNQAQGYLVTGRKPGQAAGWSARTLGPCRRWRSHSG